MVDMQDGLVFDATPAEDTGMVVPSKDRLPERFDPIPIPLLVLCPFRRLLPAQEGF